MSETEDLTPELQRGLTALLDALIPRSRDGRLPGAGELGLAAVLAEQEPDLRPLVERGLAELDARAADRGAQDFASLPVETRCELLSGLSAGAAALVPALLFHTYTRYYQERRVVLALGLEHRPPYPEGFPMEPTDASLFENVRRRGRLYR
jgi:hypothetical protein